MIPVYIVTGLLESGKTTFVKDTLMTQEWIDAGTTVLICCEEGEAEYAADYLKQHDMIKIDLADQADFTPALLKGIERNYEPIQVIVEFNGMWNFGEFITTKLPRSWEIQGVYSTINGETLDMYLKNMRKMVMEQLTESELLIINRTPEEFDRGAFKRAVKVQNPMAQLIFERPDGTIIQPGEEDLPFDAKAAKISLEETDFGIWYVDAFDHPERYEGKEISFLAQTFRPKGMPENMFVPGRMIMTCCAEDVRFYGYPCQAREKLVFNPGDWVKVTVKFGRGFQTPQGEERPLLSLVRIKTAKAAREEVVYLN